MPGGGLARMGGGPRQIQDSQKGVINKSAHKERGGGGGYLIFYFCFIFIQTLSVLWGLTVHGLHASWRLTVHNWKFKANKENSHKFYEMIIYVPIIRPEVFLVSLVSEEFPLLQWSTERSSSQSLISTELLEDNISCSCLEMFTSISKLVWKKDER